jgi:hypothetical protein
MGSKKLGGTRPDLTLAQLVALLGGGLPVLLTLLAAFGVFDPNAAQREALSDATQWLGLMAVGLFGADAAIRIGRNVKDGRVEAAALAPASAAPDTMPYAPLPYAPLTPPMGERIAGQLGKFEHEDTAAAVAAEGLPSDEEEFGERAGDSRPAEEEPIA